MRFMRNAACLALALFAFGSARAVDCAGIVRAAQDESCLRHDLAVSDATLSRQFDTLIARADLDRRELLLSSQQAWRRYRDSQCTLERDLTRVMHDAYGRPGTIAPKIEVLCQLRTNDERVSVLRGVDRDGPRR